MFLVVIKKRGEKLLGNQTTVGLMKKWKVHAPTFALLDQQEQGDDWLTLENKDMAGVSQSVMKNLNIWFNYLNWIYSP